MGLFYLICYAIVTCIITIRSIIKKRSSIYCFLWIEYAISSIFCVLCKIFQPTLVGISTMHNRWYDLSDTTWYGYALIIICNLIAFKPFLIFNKNNSMDDIGKDKESKKYMKYYSIGYIFLAIFFVIFSFENIKNVLLYKDFATVRNTLYNNSNNESILIITNNIFANLAFKICTQLKYLSIVISLIMIKEKYNIPLAVTLLASDFFVYYIYASANAARGGLLILVFCALLMVLTFFKYLSKGNKHKIIIIAFAVMYIVMIFFINVTNSRVSSDTYDDNTMLRNIAFYLGHGPIEFSKVTGSIQDFAYGKTIIGRALNHYFGVSYDWDEIQRQIGYPPIGAVFVTYLGYIYTDFGVASCIIFTYAWSYLMCRLLKEEKIRISTIFIFLYYLSFYVTGNFVVGRLEYVGLITAHLIAFFIRLIENQIKNSKMKRRTLDVWNKNEI